MSKLWKEFAERGLYFIKAASVVYLIREHVVEVTVVSRDLNSLSLLETYSRLLCPYTTALL